MNVLKCSYCSETFAEWSEKDAHEPACRLRYEQRELSDEMVARQRHENSFRTVYQVLSIIVEKNAAQASNRRKWNTFFKNMRENKP